MRDLRKISSGGVANPLTADLGCADYVVGRPELKDYSETVNARGSISGAQTIDLELGNVVTMTIAGATVFTFSNPSPTGRACSMTWEVTNGGAGAITWPSSVKWPGGTVPTLTTSGVDILTFVTVNAGTTYRGALAQLDSK